MSDSRPTRPRTTLLALAGLCLAACGGSVIVDDTSTLASGGAGGAATTTSTTSTTSTTETTGSGFDWLCSHDADQGGCLDVCEQLIAACDLSAFCAQVMSGECVNCVRILLDGGWVCP